MGTPETIGDKVWKLIRRYLLPSGILPILFSGLITVITSFRDGEVNMSYLGLTILILLLQAINNLVLYVRDKVDEPK